MSLPLLLSVPHAGWKIPPEVRRFNRLGTQEILHDGDRGARGIYALQAHVAAFRTTDIGRAYIDMNRAPEDIRKDGVVKTHTCWDVPVYRAPLPTEVVQRLIDTYHRPYHRDLERFASRAVAGVDCHTMAEAAPPEAPDPGRPRPRICLSDADGTLPEAWFQALSEALAEAFGVQPSHNRPFNGGYIIRHHSKELPWVQLELNRGSWLDIDEKRERVLQALGTWCQRLETLSTPAADRRRRPT